MSKTILVTGGAGFIGSNFVKYIYTKYEDYKIIVLDALTYAGSVHNLPQDSFDSQRFEFWYGNVCNAELVDTLVAKSDMVVHFAAESHVTRSIYDNLCFFETDVLGTQAVASAVLKYRDRVERFVHISTSEVYGSAMSDLMAEDHPLNPMSPYAAAKCGADRLVYSYFHTYDIPAVIIRPFNNFGPSQHLEKMVPRFITSCILNETLNIHGDGSASRDWLHVSDHCRALDRVLHAPISQVRGQTFNLGTAKSHSILEIAEMVRAQFNNPPPMTMVSNRPGQVFRHTCDATKANNTLDWRPQVSLEEGIKETVAWYKANEHWWRPQMWLRSIPIVTATGKKELH